MGWRFRRSVKLLPGVRLNVSRSGITTTVGARGAHVTFGGGRTRYTTSIPGTGLSYSQTVSAHSRSPGARSIGSILVWLLISVTVLAFCNRQHDTVQNATHPPEIDRASALATPTMAKTDGGTAAVGASPETYIEYFVAVASANVRTEPDGRLLGREPRGTKLSVYEIMNGWARLSPRTASPRWVMVRLLCQAPGCYEPSAKHR
jgi:hypothetical protein